jgi:hypothetical protein
VTRLDDIFESLADARGWQEPGAPIALRLVDALVQNDHRDFARQAMRLRRTLEAEGMAHDAVRVSAGLQIQRAVPVIGWVHGHSPAEASERIRRAVARCKAAGVFPWHLLDG